MRSRQYDEEMTCADCGYVYTAVIHVDGDTGVVSILHSSDENCAECGSANVQEVE